MASRTYNLGICTEIYNEETIKRMLEHVNLSVHAALIKDIENDATRMMDTLFLINPIFNPTQKTIFLDFLLSGGTALYILTMDRDSVDGCRDMLSYFGIQLISGKKTKKLPVEYTSAFPAAYKQGKKDFITSKALTHFAIMEIKRDYERKCIPLISIRKAFSKQHYAVKVTHGNGQLIVMSSVAMPEDRAALLTYLLEKSSGQRQEFQEERNTKIRSLLPNIINESFEVYTEIPVEIIQRKLAVENCKLDTIDLLLKIEEAIRAGEIAAMISNNTIIKK